MSEVMAKEARELLKSWREEYNKMLECRNVLEEKGHSDKTMAMDCSIEVLRQCMEDLEEKFLR